VNPGWGHNPSDSGDLTLAPIEKKGQRVGIDIGIESDLSLALHLDSHRVPVGIDDCPCSFPFGGVMEASLTVG